MQLMQSVQYYMLDAGGLSLPVSCVPCVHQVTGTGRPKYPNNAASETVRPQMGYGTCFPAAMTASRVRMRRAR